MTKAIRMMQENIKLIDLVIELVDARIPLSSRNPDIDRLAAGKFRIVLLGKADLFSLCHSRLVAGLGTCLPREGIDKCGFAHVGNAHYHSPDRPVDDSPPAPRPATSRE